MATYTKRGSSYLIRASAGYTVDGKQVRPSMTWKPEPGMTEKQIERELNRQMVLFDEKCRGAVQGDGHIKLLNAIPVPTLSFLRCREPRRSSASRWMRPRSSWTR